MKRTARAIKVNRPKGYRTILTSADAKTVKGEKLGYRTGIFYGAPVTNPAS
jgi:hypothetical protein